jgi:amino acid transporter
MRLRMSQNYIRLMFYVSAGTAVAVFIAGLFVAPAATPINREIISLDLSKYGALYSAAVLWLLGVEVPFNMSAEFREHKRAVGTMFLWGSLVLLVAYIIGIAGILWTTPVAEIDATSGVAKGVERVWPLGGALVALAISLAVSSQDVAYMNTYSRLLFISGIEKRLPAVFSQVTSHTRVPVPALLMQVLGAVVVLLIFSTQPNLAVAFNIYIASLVIVWCASLFYLYFGIVRARRIFANRYEKDHDKIWMIPGGSFGVWVVAIWGSVFNAAAIYYVFAIPLTTAINASEWRTWLISIAVIVGIAGVVIFVTGRKRASDVNIEEELRRYATYTPPEG